MEPCGTVVAAERHGRSCKRASGVRDPEAGGLLRNNALAKYGRMTMVFRKTLNNFLVGREGPEIEMSEF